MAYLVRARASRAGVLVRDPLGELVRTGVGGVTHMYLSIVRDRAPMVQRTLLNLLRLLLLGTEHRWCEDPIESAPFIIRDRAPMVQRTLLNLLRLLLLLGTEHRWCEDPIESAPFIIRDRAPMVRGPY